MTRHASLTRRTLTLASVLLLCTSRAALAQGWTLALFVDPFPSPYASDWETNPNISSLTIASPSSAAQDVRLAYQVTDSRGRNLASGSSDPLGISPGALTVLTSVIDIAGSSRRDQTLWDQMQRTGRIPEGTYRACVVMASTNGLVLGEDCDAFTIVYPDAPQLIAPAPGDVITTPAPFFQWTPVVVPPAYAVQYVLQVAEVLSNQTAEEALSAGIVHYQQPDLLVTNIQYPPNGQPFEPGKRYAWRVVVLDENGFAPTANGGLSEIRTFVFDDAAPQTGVRSDVALTLTNEFDVDTASAIVTTDSTATDVSALCIRWSLPISRLTLSTASPLGLKRFAGQPSVLFRDTTARRWWIATKNSRNARSVLVGGDCNQDKTRILWIASRDSAVQHNITTRMANRRAGADSMFGFIVLSRVSETVQAPAGFPEAEAFLGSRSIDVAMGLNVYMLLSLREWALWPFFQKMGFNDRELELKGFLGWDASWSLGVGVGEDPGPDLSTERKFLVLRADFPKRSGEAQPVLKVAGSGGGQGEGGGGGQGGGGGRGGGGGNIVAPVPEEQPAPVSSAKWFKSMGLSIEVSVGDSLGRLFKLDEKRKETSYSLDLVGKLIHTIEVTDDLSLVGFIGLDLARESQKGPAQEALARWDWLRAKRSAASSWLRDKQRALQRIDGWIAGKIQPPSAVEDPEVNLDIVFGYGVEGNLASAAGPEGTSMRLEAVNLDGKFRPSEKKVTLVLSATAGVGDVEGLVKLGASKAFDLESPDTVKLKRTAVEKSVALKERVLAHAGDLPDCGGNATHDDPVCKAWREYMKANKDVEDTRNPSWRVRLSAGHMPLGPLLQLIKSLIASVGQ